MRRTLLVLLLLTPAAARAAAPETLRTRTVGWDIGFKPATETEWLDRVARELQSALDAGAKVIVFPELIGWGLAPYAPKGTSAAAFVTRRWNENLLPRLAKTLGETEAFVVLGSYPHYLPAEDRILNRASVWHAGAWRAVDKLHPTPLEEFEEKPLTRAGETLPLFQVFGATAAVVICYSVEMPAVAAALKEAGVLLVAVPAATSGPAGLGRVRRSASARAVELGAAVLLSGLTGTQGEWKNLGGPASYLPAQKAISRPVREGRARWKGFKHQDAVLPWRTLINLRGNPPPRETRPFLTPGGAVRLDFQ